MVACTVLMSSPGGTRADHRESTVSLDLVIPIYNEEEALRLLFARLAAVFSTDSLPRHGIRSVRYLMVDDGSTDRSASMIARAIEEGVPAVLYRFSRNFGHQHAVSAGMDHSTADLVAIIDADLQDPPEIIPEMVERWRQGSDV